MALSTVSARPSARAGLLQVCAAGVLWGTGGLVVTVLHDRDGLDALTVSAWRMLLAAVALVGLALVARRWRAVVTTLRSDPRVAVLVGCGTALYQGLYFVAVLLVGVSVATVVSLGLAPPLAAAWEHLTARTRPSVREVGVMAAALTGLALVSLTAGHLPDAGEGRPALGLALAVASAATYAATTLLGHGLAQRADPVALTTCATAAGAVALSPILVVATARQDLLPTADPVSLLLLAYHGGALALAYLLLYAGLRTVSGSAATVATLVEPVSAAGLAVLLLGERLPWSTVAGSVLVLAAVAALREPDSG